MCFFTFMTVAEGGGRRALARKFQEVYIPTLKANFVLWPAVQVLNFRVVPIQFQIVSLSIRGRSAYIDIISALCVRDRYRVDSISFPDQLVRGGLSIFDHGTGVK